MRKKVVLWISIPAIFIFLLVGGGVFAARHFYSKINTTDQLVHDEVAVNDVVLNREQDLNVVNIALLGIDQDGDGSNGRSDAIKMISLDMNHKKIKMTSFQRDTLIYLPDPENDFDKLNHAYWYGEAPLTLKVLNYNFDLNLTRYVAFNFDAIEKIIDIIGGIELDIHENELNVTNDYIRAMNDIVDTDEDGLSTLN